MARRQQDRINIDGDARFIQADHDGGKLVSCHGIDRKRPPDLVDLQTAGKSLSILFECDLEIRHHQAELTVANVANGGQPRESRRSRATMSFWLHSTILATIHAASVAVGVAAVYDGIADPLAAKGDRLPLATPPAVTFVTVEAQNGGVSVLSRVPLSGDCHD